MPLADLWVLARIIFNYDDAVGVFAAIGFRLTADIDQSCKRWVTVQSAGGGASVVLAEPNNAAQAKVAGT